LEGEARPCAALVGDDLERYTATDRIEQSGIGGHCRDFDVAGRQRRHRLGRGEDLALQDDTLLAEVAPRLGQVKAGIAEGAGLAGEANDGGWGRAGCGSRGRGAGY